MICGVVTYFTDLEMIEYYQIIHVTEIESLQKLKAM